MMSIHSILKVIRIKWIPENVEKHELARNRQWSWLGSIAGAFVFLGSRKLSFISPHCCKQKANCEIKSLEFWIFFESFVYKIVESFPKIKFLYNNIVTNINLDLFACVSINNSEYSEIMYTEQ